jgi:PAS domain S-box-containing protein
MEHGEGDLGRYTEPSKRLQLVLVLGAFAIFSLAFFPLNRLLGPVAGALIALPVLLASWLFGFKIAILAGFLSILLATLLYNLAGYPGWDVVFTRGAWPGFLVMIMMSTTVGYLRDLVKRLGQEFDKRRQAEKVVLMQRATLEAINKVFQEALTCETEVDIVRTCLSVAQELTSSKFGFIGEINPAGRFDTIAISNPGWDACNMPDSEATILIKDMEIRGIDRSLLREGKSRIVNDPASHPDRVGTPEGHPPIRAFLGVPLKQAGRTIGMIGLANKESGYEMADQKAIEALSIAFIEALERKRAEVALQESEERYSSLFDSVPIGLYRTMPDGRIVEANPALLNMLGYPDLETFQGVSAEELYVDPQGRQRWQEKMEREGVVRGYETRLRRRDGTIIWVRDNARAIRDKAGRVLYYDGSLADITKRVQAWKEINTRVEFMRRLTIISETLNRSLSWEDVIIAIGQGGKALSEADRAALYLRHSNDTVTCPWSYGLSSVYLEQVTMRVRDVPGGQLFQSMEPILISDVKEMQEGALLRRLAQEEGIRSIGLWPLVYEEKVIAAVGIYYNELHSWSDAEKEYMMAYARQAAVALENARLLEETNRRLKHMQALRAIDEAITGSLDLSLTLDILLDHVTAQLKVDAANVLLLDPHTKTLDYAAGRGFRTDVLKHTHLRLGESHAGKVALERRIVHIPDLNKRETGFLRSPLIKREGFIVYFGVPLIAKGNVKGVLEIFHRAPLEPDTEWFDFLKALSGQAAIAIDNATLFDGMQRANIELTIAYDTTLEGWSRTLELRDIETEGHSQRVTEMTLRLGRTLGMTEEELVHVRRGALLHDIGKMGIPDNILHKPGKLTDEEWEIMYQHPVYAKKLLSHISFLRPAMDIPYCHHEKWDGTGYPQKLKGEQIPLAARIFAVVDVWDALTSDRPYRKAWKKKKAVEYIREQAGKHFDPKVVEAFLEMIGYRS